MIDVSNYEAVAATTLRDYDEAASIVKTLEASLKTAQGRLHKAACVAEEAQERLCAAQWIAQAQEVAARLSPAMRTMLTSEIAQGSVATAQALYRRKLIYDPNPRGPRTPLGQDVADLLSGRHLSDVPDDMQPNKDK